MINIYNLRFVTTLIVLLSTVIQGCIISQKNIANYYRIADEQKPYDAVIVPGVPFENGQWSQTMKGRVLWSVFLYKKGITRNIIFSGSAVYTPFIEAKIMSLYAMCLGVDSSNVFVERHAEHSTENVYYSNQLGRKLGFKKIALATDPFQSKSLKSFIRKKKMDVSLIPMYYDSLATMPQTNPVIDSMSAHVTDFVALPDRESFFKRLHGTLGKDINPDLYK